MHKQVAKYVHDLLGSNAVNIPGNQIDNVSQARIWLRGIAEGELVVGAPVKDDATEAAPAEPQR